MYLEVYVFPFLSERLLDLFLLFQNLRGNSLDQLAVICLHEKLQYVTEPYFIPKEQHLCN